MRTGSGSRLVFTSVELAPPGRVGYRSMPVDARGLPHIRRGLAFRRVAMEQEKAIRWYRELADSPVLPLPIEPERTGRHDGEPVEVAQLQDEPPWPDVITPKGMSGLHAIDRDNQPFPFLPRVDYPVQLHRQIAAPTAAFDDVLASDDLIAWLHRRLHVDLREFPEFLGGAIAIRPDPDVRRARVGVGLGDSDTESLIAVVQAHPGRSLAGMSMDLIEDRFGARAVHREQLDGSFAHVIRPLDHRVDMVGQSLLHPDRGLLAHQEPAPILRSVHLELRLASRQVVVPAREARGADNPEHQHRIQEHASRSRSKVPHKEDQRSHAEQQRIAAGRRRERRMAELQGALWLEDASTARSVVRDLISEARQELLLVDCYANAQDLVDFAHFVTSTEVCIRVLTSSNANPSQRRPDAVPVEAVLQSFHARGLQPTIRSMRGRPIHDRFIVVDSTVWLSGNSLGYIGERASVLVRLHDPRIRQRLIEAFEAGAAWPAEQVPPDDSDPPGEAPRT